MSLHEKNRFKKILDCLENETNEILLDDKIIESARKSVLRMTQIGRWFSAKFNYKYIDLVVRKALDEDLKPLGDITTRLLNHKKKKIRAKIIAKQNGIVAGIDFVNKHLKS